MLVDHRRAQVRMSHNVTDKRRVLGLSHRIDPQMRAVHGRRRKFDAVLVWKIDRFGRSLKHLVNALADLCAYGVAFISFRDNLDLSTPSGRLMFQIIGAMAEFERSLIQERVKAGLRNARAKGKKFGRPRAHVDAQCVAALRRDGLSWSQVCRTLNVSKGSAQRSVGGLPKSDVLAGNAL
jgi:DNA invertase Pin-like site-specific DNA recombinase